MKESLHVSVAVNVLLSAPVNVAVVSRLTTEILPIAVGLRLVRLGLVTKLPPVLTTRFPMLLLHSVAPVGFLLLVLYAEGAVFLNVSVRSQWWQIRSLWLRSLAHGGPASHDPS